MGIDLSGLLVCTRCGAELPAEPEWLPTGTQCRNCRRIVPVVRGVPRFVASEEYAESFGFEWLRHARTQLDALAEEASHWAWNTFHHDDVSVDCSGSTRDCSTVSGDFAEFHPIDDYRLGFKRIPRKTAEVSPQRRESEATFRAKTGLTPEDVAGKLILDVGCGMGRFADVVSRWGGRVIGVDLSRAVEAAQANLGDRPNVRILQADLFNLPFRRGTFDLAYSIGVLHHTPNCERAMKCVAPYVKPGGRLCVWVYGQMGSWERVSRRYRLVTTRLPHALLHALCYVAAPWYYVGRVPLVGRFLAGILPVSQHPDWRWRVLDTFDWYSPRYQSMHTPGEVHGWFVQAGYEDVTDGSVPVSVSGRRQGPGLRVLQERVCFCGSTFLDPPTKESR